MPLFDFLKRPNKITVKEASIPLVSRFMSFISRSGGFSTKEPSEYYEGWVFACVRAIAEEVAKIDLRLYRIGKDGTKEQVTDHPAIKSIRTVNDFFTKHMLFERLQSNLELDGNEYWFIQESKTKGDFEIYPLIPRFVSPKVDSKNYVASYEYKLDNQTITLKTEQVIHFRNFNPKSDILGMSTLKAALAAVDTDDGAKTFNRQYFKNSAIPNVVLEYPQSLAPEEIQKLKNAWNDEYAGMQNAYKTAVASDGLKVTKLDTSHTDMEFIEQRRFSRDEILAIFRVPKIIVGIMEDVNRASAEAALFAFMTWTVLPKMARIVDTLNEFYLPLFSDDELRFECANKPPEDKDQSVVYYQSGLNNGWLSPNDIRRMEGLPEVEGGDSFYLPLSLMEYGKVKEVKKVDRQQQTTKSIDTAVKGLSEKIVEIFETQEKQEKAKQEADMFEKKGERKNSAEIKRRLGNERIMAKKSKELFAGQQKRAIDGLRKYLEAKNWKAALKAKKIPLLDYEKELNLTIDLFSPVIAKIVEEEGTAALAYLGLEDAFDVNNPDAQKFIKAATKKLSTSMTTTTIDALNTSILEGLEAGEAIAGLTERIMESTAFDLARAETIARTETTRASAQSEIEAWKETEVVASLVWWTAQDERVDDECGLLHGTEVDIGSPFVSASELDDLGEDDYMGNGIDAPPRHPNCRCTLIPILKESKELTRKPRKKFVV